MHCVQNSIKVMSYQISPGEVEQSIHLMVAAIITGFDQEEKIIDDQQAFDHAVGKLIDAVFEKFRVKYERIKNGEKFRNIFLNELRSRQDDMFRSPALGNALSQVMCINDDLDREQSFFDAILIYCERENIQEQQPVIHYLVVLNALLKVHMQIRAYSLVQPQSAQTREQQSPGAKLSSMTKPYRFFSFDLNVYRFVKDPDLTEEENTRARWQNQQLVLETKFASAFRKTNADSLPAFLDEQYLLTPAPRDEFIDLVAQIGNANLHTADQGSSIKKADVFRVWIDAKKTEIKKAKTVEPITHVSPSLFREGLDPQAYLNILKTAAPPVTDQTGHYKLGPRSKGAVVAWLDALERYGKINNRLDTGMKAKLVNELIPGLDISKRSLGNGYGRAHAAYRSEFLRLIEKV